MGCEWCVPVLCGGLAAAGCWASGCGRWMSALHVAQNQVPLIFACVGLSTDAKIKGKWFCATCSADIKRQKKLEKKREEAKDADKPGRK